MKNKIIILLFAIGGIFASCSDAYDIQQKGDVFQGDEAFREAKDIRRGLNVIYSSIPASTEVALGSIFTDEVSIGLNNGGQGLISGEFGFMMESNNSYAASLWNSYYTMINRINRLEVITKNLLENAAAGSQEMGDLNDNLADLYILRAFAHYKLFAYFTPDYTNGSGVSAIILDHVPPYDYTYSLPRNTVNEVKKFIEDDLERASTIRSSGWEATPNYVNSGTIAAIRVKLYAMTGQSDKVIEYGQEIMNRYSLAKAERYEILFARVANQIDVNNGLDLIYEDNAVANEGTNVFVETIFRLKTTTSSGPSVIANWYSARARYDGSYFYEMGRSLYNELDKLDPTKLGGEFTPRSGVLEPREDVRYNVNLVPRLGREGVGRGTEVLTSYETATQSEYESQDRLLIGKYRGTTGAELKNDVHIFRVADILLAMAEARAAQGQITSASTEPDDLIGNYSSVYSIIYNIRAHRTRSVKENFSDSDYSKVTMPTFSDQRSAYEAILNERRVELAFEGHRYLDMKRLGVKAGSQGFTRYSKDCVVNGACNLPVNSHKMTLPIPVGEMNGNNSLTTDSQNPGY